MDNLRVPFFVAAIFLAGLVVAVETGSGFFVKTQQPQAADLARSAKALAIEATTPSGVSGGGQGGYAIAALACLDGLVLFTVALMAAQFFIGARLQGRVQGIASLVFASLALSGAISAIVAIIAKLLLMVGFLLAIPFGTLIYLIIWGSFDTGRATAALGSLLALKLSFAGCLLLAQQRFLQNKGLVLIIVTSLVANFVVSFLHAAVPGILVSITDAIAGIVVLILGAIWAVVFLVGAVISVTKALA